jgi:hypothetical protein
MSEHRFKHHFKEEYTSSISTKELRSVESLFDGPKKLEEIYFDYITEIEREKAYRQGFADGHAKGQSEAEENLNSEVRKRIEEYIAKVFQISNYIIRIAIETLNSDGNSNLKIIEPRARFSFDKNKIQLLFLIEASIEKEIDFIKFCGNIEKLILELEHDYLANISCINISGPKEIDYSLIKTDYPFCIKRSS